MIKIETKSETTEGYDIETHIEGSKFKVMHQMTAVFDDMYRASPEVFIRALSHSQFFKDGI